MIKALSPKYDIRLFHKEDCNTQTFKELVIILVMTHSSVAKQKTLLLTSLLQVVLILVYVWVLIGQEVVGLIS